jgi:hypothetical protein
MLSNLIARHCLRYRIQVKDLTRKSRDFSNDTLQYVKKGSEIKSARNTYSRTKIFRLGHNDREKRDVGHNSSPGCLGCILI